MKLFSIGFVKKVTIAAALLVLAGLAAKVSEDRFGHDVVFGLVPLFDLNGEGNIPAWFSSTLLLLCALCLWETTRKLSPQTPYYVHWKGLILLFVCLSIDEAAGIHEMLGMLTGRFIPTTGFFYYSWSLFVGIPFVMIFSLLYARFLTRLPPKTKTFFISAGILYVLGGLGMEMIGGNLVFHGGEGTLLHTFCITLEEILEMSGTLLFLYALIQYYENSIESGQENQLHHSLITATADPRCELPAYGGPLFQDLPDHLLMLTSKETGREIPTTTADRSF